MKRNCRPVAASVTVSDWRVSPGPSRARNVTPSARISPASRSPVSPPRATSARLSPPSARIARLTFSPPPPGSSAGSLQRSFSPGTSWATSVAMSSAGFSVSVRMGVWVMRWVRGRLR